MDVLMNRKINKWVCCKQVSTSKKHIFVILLLTHTRPSLTSFWYLLWPSLSWNFCLSSLSTNDSQYFIFYFLICKNLVFKSKLWTPLVHERNYGFFSFFWSLLPQNLSYYSALNTEMYVVNVYWVTGYFWLEKIYLSFMGI